MTIYDFTVEDAQGKEVKLSDYRDKVLLIVNVASHCGFAGQYKSLEALYQKYKDQGLVILAFPSTTFKEEFTTNEEIQSYCETNLGLSFPLLSLIEVNGPDQAPIYQYMKSLEPDEFIDVPKDHKLYDHFLKFHGRQWDQDDISWNFNKFLFDRQGHLVGRYASPTTPEELDAKIKALL